MSGVPGQLRNAGACNDSDMVAMPVRNRVSSMEIQS